MVFNMRIVFRFPYLQVAVPVMTWSFKMKKSLTTFTLILVFLLTGCSGGDSADTSPSNNLVATKVIISAPLISCPNGGVTVNGGIDSNGNNVLDDSEVTSTQYVCNGTNGLTTLVQVNNESAGENCIYGGKTISVGLDTNNNGILGSEEITSQNYLCNSKDGADGADGLTSLVKIINEPEGMNCPDGGVKITSGIDANNNGLLDLGEEGTPSYVCNGADGATGSVISPPMGVVAAGADGKVVLTWNENPADMITSSNIYWSTEANINKTNSIKLPGASSPYTVNGLTNGTTYYFFITGENVSGEGPASLPVYGIPGAPPQLAPEDVTAIPGDGFNTISFTASTDASVTGYAVYRSLTPDVTVTPDNHAQGYFSDTTTFIDMAINGTTYYYVVTALNDYGDSVASNEVSATPQGPPPFPQDLIATAGDSQVVLSWDASPGAISYNVYRDGIMIASSVGTTYTDANLTNGNWYSYFVTAVNTYGESCLGCNDLQARPIVAPLAPMDVYAASGDGQINLSWTQVSTADSYIIYWSTSPDVINSSPNGITVCCQYATSYTHAGLTNGVSYYYVVAAMNDFEGPVSAEVSAMPLAGSTSPITLDAANLTDTTASLSGNIINPSSYTTTVWFEYGETTSYGSTTQSLAYAYSGDIWFDQGLTGLTQATTYHYRVVSQNTAGTFYGNDKTFTTENTPQVVDSGHFDGFTVDDVNIYYRNYSDVLYKPISGGASTQLNISYIESGLYDGPMAVDTTYVYTISIDYGTSPETYRIYKIDKSSGVATVMYSGLSQMKSLATDVDYVYWIEDAAIRKVNINTLVISDIATGLSGVNALAIDSANVYWADNSGIKAVAKTGGVITVLTPYSPSLESSIYVDANHVYWVGYDFYSGYHSINKMSLAGGEVIPLVVEDQNYNGYVFAIDSTNVYFASSSYYSNDNISKISKSGGSITTVSYAPEGVNRLMVDDTNVYWINQNRDVLYQSHK